MKVDILSPGDSGTAFLWVGSGDSQGCCPVVFNLIGQFRDFDIM